MVRVYGLIKGYTPVKVHMPDGNKVKINIRTDLLSSVRKTIVGTLHFNGTTVYLPQDANITIGSSRKCEIRIKDPTVEAFHAMISSAGETVAIEHLHQSGKTAILGPSNEIKTIGPQDEPLPLANGDKVVFILSGDKKFLQVDFKLRQSVTEDLKELLAAQLQPKPAIERVAVEQASAGQALAVVEDSPPPLKALVAGTSFAAARTIDEILVLYPNKIKEAKTKDLVIYASGTCSLSGSVMATISSLLSNNPYAVIPLAGLGLLALTCMIMTRFDGWAASLNKSLAKVLSQCDINEVSLALRSKKLSEREKVLFVLEKDNPTIADAIRLRLPEAELALEGQNRKPELQS